MKFKTTIIALFSFFLCFAQEGKTIKSGIITLTNDAKKEFVNLTYKEKMVVYTNVSTNLKEHLMLMFVKNIEEKELEFVEKKESTETDTLFKPNYPEGLYLTKEDFINKKPSQIKKVIPKNLMGKKKPLLNIAHACYFYDAETNKMIKKVFAISYKGHLYFHAHSILKNRNKTDRAQSANSPFSYSRVIEGGDKYFYSEVDLANQWAQGFAYGGIGGVVGGVLAKDMIYGKGVVWDFKNQEFNIFKNCKDFNEFIEEVYPEGKQKCEKQQPDMLKVREAVQKFK